MKSLLVTSTAEGTGKTGIAIALGKLAKDRGLSVGYMKPKGTRLRSSVGKTMDRDPMLAREVLGLEAEMHELEPIVYSPTFIDQAVRGQEEPDELRESVLSNYELLSTDREFMVVEGGGRYTTGGIVDLTDADVADLVGAGVLIVAEFRNTGDIDDVLAVVDAVGDNLEGVVFNSVHDADFDKVEGVVASYLEARGVPVVGVLPREPSIAGVTVPTLVSELNASLLTEVANGELIERFLVGAMSGESSLRQFRRTKDAVVITGGDRPEVQNAALESPGVNCLVLTGGLEPPATILSKAEDKGVPIMVVDTDALTTINNVENLIQKGRMPDVEMVEAVAELLHNHADIDELLGIGD